MFNIRQGKLSLFDLETAYIVSGSILLMVIAYIILNAISMAVKKERYQGIRFTTKNIAYITMFSAVSVAATVVISLTIPVTVLPPIRVAFEGLMIKISGFIFGPVIGVLCGLITELLVMLFVPSLIHPAYIITIIAFGFISGLVGELRNLFRTKPWIILIITHIFIISFGVSAILLTEFAPSFEGIPKGYVPFKKGVPIRKWIMEMIIAFGILLTLITLWSTWFYYVFWKKDIDSFNNIVPIILLAVINEYIVTVLIASWGDVYLLTGGNSNPNDYGLAMIPRLAMAPLKIIFNTAIIYITWKTVRPLIKEDR